MHNRRRHVERGQQAELGRAEQPPGGQDQIAHGHVLASAADVLTGYGRTRHGHPVHPAVGPLKLDDGVGAGRQRRACHDPRRGAARHRRRCARRRRDIPGDRQGDRPIGAGADDVRGVHGVSVHGRVVEPGQGGSRVQARREHAAVGGPQRQRPWWQRDDRVEDAGDMLVHRFHHRAGSALGPPEETYSSNHGYSSAPMSDRSQASLITALR